jgi:phenylacetate-CoA ligase
MKKAISKKNLWEKTPLLLKQTVGRALEVFPPAWLFGKRFRANCDFVQQAQHWPAERTQEYQLKKLRDVLNLAYQKTGYYRRLFDGVGFHPRDLYCLEDMNKLPVIDKQIVMDNLSDMCTRTVESVDVDFASTGGTSGTPLNFYMNANRSSVEYAYLTNSWERAGYKLEMPMAVLRGRVVHPDRNGLRHEYDPLLRHHYYSNFHMSDENIARYLEHIATIGPCFLHVYPSSVAALARYILRKGRQAPENIKGIIAESEIVYPEQRLMVEDLFGCRYFSCYGHSEKLVLAAGCEHSNDYHVWPTYGYFELLDENDKPVTKQGQRGEIVGTGFINTVVPFIRYRTGDWATYVSDHCQLCGREHIVIRDIRGHRTQEVLIAADGSEISWTALNMHDDTFLRVKQFQFMQETPGQAVLRIVPANGFVKEDVDRIHCNLGKKLEDRIRFTVEIVDSIALSSRGKAIYVDQRISTDN